MTNLLADEFKLKNGLLTIVHLLPEL